MGNLSAVKTALKFYDELWLIRDKRVDGWPMMDSPLPTIGLCLAYIYICCGLGPALMKDRPAFVLRKPIMVYNVLQVVFSGYVFYEASVAGWLTGKPTDNCQSKQTAVKSIQTGVKSKHIAVKR